MDSLLHHVDGYMRLLAQYPMGLKWSDNDQYEINRKSIFYNSPVRTSDHNDEFTPGRFETEILYVVDGETGLVMRSGYEQDIANTLGIMETAKANVLHRLMDSALELLLNHNEKDNDDLETKVPIRWPRLNELLVEKKGSFPFLFHYSDYIGCNYNNWNNQTESIPLFTVAASVHCNHTFPFPSYTLFESAKQNSEEWYDTMNEYKDNYPSFSNKISKVVWRGRLTGNMSDDGEARGIRWHLAKFVHDSNQLTSKELDLFDVKITAETEHGHLEWVHPDEFGGMGWNFHMPMNDFQNYKAIIDVDGYSWSSRMSSLLCYNSVVLKIEPEYIDYYYYPKNNDNDNIDPYTIMPWKHYIPIKGDFSDLVEKTAYAVDPANEEHILSIIKNANEWCANKYTVPSTNIDVLDIWEQYVKTLDKSTQLKKLYLSSESDNKERLLLENENWEDQWNQMKDEVYSGPFEMSKVWYYGCGERCW